MTLTDVDWQVVLHYVFFFCRWHHPCGGGGDIASCRTCGVLASVKVTACRFSLVHSFLLCSMSPAGGGVTGGGGTQMCMRFWRSRGRVLGEGRRAIVLPPCPPQATEDLIWQLQGGTWKDQNKNHSPLFVSPPFLWGERNQSVSSHCGGWVWLFVSAGGGGSRQADRQAAWMHIMTTIEQTSTVQPWKPSGRGWEFQGWR